MSDPVWLAALHARCFTVPRPYTEAEFSNLISAPSVFLCTRAHGFALGRLSASEAELLTLAVDPDHRRLGIARALLQSYHRHARSSGAEQSFLEVDATNAAARALYVAFDYCEVGRRPGYYRPANQPPRDAVVMRMKFEGAAP